MPIPPLKYKILKAFAAFSLWRKVHINDNGFILILCAVIGALAGVAAYVMKEAIKFVSHLCMTGLDPDAHFSMRFLWLPFAGILLTSIYTHYILRQNISQGVGKIRRAYSTGNYRLNPTLTFSSIIGSALTLGFGGSAGAEGPIAYTAAAIGTTSARLLKVDPSKMKMVLTVGAGAGIAAIFKAPIGGAFFALEVLGVPFTTFWVVALAIACIAGALTCFACTGFYPDIVFERVTDFHPSLTWWTLLLGLFCGIYSVYYNLLQKHTYALFKSISNRWVKNIIAGITLSFFIFLIPSLYGEGYNVIGNIVNGHWERIHTLCPLVGPDPSFWQMMCILALILGIKSYLVAAVNVGGGVAGDFAPTLYAGAIAGFFFALLINLIPGVEVPATHFAIVGMAAVMAGTIHAPLMAIFITVEMSSNYEFFFPIVLAAFVSYLVVKLVTPQSKYRPVRHDDIAEFVKSNKLT